MALVHVALYLACLLSFQSMTSALWQESWNGNINTGSPLTGSFRKNLQTYATITVQHSIDVQFCLQRLVELPGESRWNQGACTTYISLPVTPPSPPAPAAVPSPVASPAVSPVQSPAQPSPLPSPAPAPAAPAPAAPAPAPPAPAPPAPAPPASLKRTVTSVLVVSTSTFFAAYEFYTWGVGVMNNTQNGTIVVNFTAADCPDQTGWNGTACAGFTTLTPGNGVPYTATPASIHLFSFNVLSNASNISLRVDPANAVVHTFLRFSGVPSSIANDSAGSNTVSFNNPRAGQWLAAVQLDPGSATTQLTVTMSMSTCTPGTYGTACNTPVAKTDQTALTYTDFIMNGYVYFSVTTSPSQSLWASFQAQNDKIAFDIYATIGTLPSPTNYIIHGCNNGPCNPVTLVKLSNSTALMGNETWIFAIITTQNSSAIGNNSTKLGSWVNSACAPECGSPSGICNANTGYCQCEDSYTGIDCTTAIGLPSQYIVLIIIAALVVTSAVIGFIAWAYMRKRRTRPNYEKV